jgi:hypothetical protein
MMRCQKDVMKGSVALPQYFRAWPTALTHKLVGIDHVDAAATPVSLLTAWKS